jgi:NADPH:quinone reductase-like Zn-dependent oxidoreductase
MSGKRMRAVLVKAPGDSSQLYLGETELPVVKEDYVLIRVHAFGLNRADIVQRQGNYPPPAGASTVLGLECAGEIVEIGASSASFASAVSALSVGQRVMALLAGGGYSQFAAAHVGCVIPMPASYSFEQAAATVEVFITSYQLMRYICKVKAGEVVLVHAGASGIGTAAIKLANFFGAKAIATVGQEAKVDYCMKMGGETQRRAAHR